MTIFTIKDLQTGVIYKPKFESTSRDASKGIHYLTGFTSPTALYFPPRGDLWNFDCYVIGDWIQNKHDDGTVHSFEVISCE